MTTQNNQALRITELDFLSIKENLKNYLRNQSEFQDFDFEGSGMSVLLDILAYNTHYMAFYLNMIGNEMFLDTAQIRASVLSHAKMIGYVPTSKQGASAKINIKVTPSVNEDDTSTLTLDKYTRFLAQDIDGINYQFVALNANTSVKANGSFSFSNVIIKQGEVVTLQYIMEPTNLSRRFEIPSSNVDVSTISIRVQESTTNTLTTVYNQANDLTEITSTTPAYFIEENENLNYTFYFGDDVIGKKPKVGNVVICTYVDTVGTVSDKISRFSLVEPIGGLFNDNVAITTVSTSSGASEKETLDEIRFRAPVFYTAQNRAVTEEDYKAILRKDFPFIESVSVWGGEKNDPVIYGKMFLSIKTKGNYVLTNLEKEQIKEHITRKRNVVTVTPEIIDPDFTYLLLKGKVYYNPNSTSFSAEEVKQLSRSAISDYVADDLNTFDSYFRKSRLQNYIERSDSSITGTDIKVYAQKRFRVDTTNVKTYTIDFNMPLKQNPHYDRLFTFPSITLFDSTGTPRLSYIEEVAEAETGIESIQVVNAGRGYVTEPTVTIIGDGSGATAVAKLGAGKITEILVTRPGTGYSIAQVRISGGSPLEAASATATLQAKVGRLRTFYYAADGKKVILTPNVGSINYETGRIILNSMRISSVTENDFYDDNYLSINIVSDTEVITPLRNRIVTIDEDDPKSVSLDVVSE